MSNKKDSRTEPPRRDVAWQPPDKRSMPIYTHEVDCAFCGRHFTTELFSPIAPVYCLKTDNPDCYQQRKAAYMRDYRAKKRGDSVEG